MVGSYVSLLLALYLLKTTNSQDCDISIPDVVGSDVQKRSEFDAGAIDYSAFLAVTQTITCHGVIKEWSIYYPGFDASNACHDLRLAVWRPQSPNNYQLVGENLWPFVAETGCDNISEPLPGRYDFIVPVGIQLPVQQGDVIGWIDEGALSSSRIIEFDEDLSGSSRYGIIRAQDAGSDCETASVGNTCNWAEKGHGGSATHLVRDYSLQAKLDKTRKPLILNLPTVIPVTVKEEKTAGEFLYTVYANNRWTSTESISPHLQFNLTDGFGYFTIDQETGVITTTTTIDFETIYPNNKFELEITVSDGPQVSDPKILTIVVEDMNEPHELIDLPDRVELDAGKTGKNYTLTTGRNKDPDIDPNIEFPNKTYFMVVSDPSVPLFTIEDVILDPSDPREIEGRIFTTQSLKDWLGNTTLYLYVYCTDGVFTSGPHVIEVIITNLRLPVIFINIPSTVKIPEDTPMGEDVFDVNAKSPNRGVGIAFRIKEQYPQSPTNEHRFSIAANGGIISVHDKQGVFDYFLCKEYKVEVVASDNIFQTDPQNVTIEITWVNKPPFFPKDRSGQKVTFSTTIKEKATAGSILPDVYLGASDRDLPIGDWIAYKLSDASGSTGSHLFSASNITHHVSVTGDVTVPAKNATRIIDIEVYVHDEAATTDQTTLQITVEDVNDHAPVFDAKEYEGTVNETDVGGKVILQLSADDQDGPDNNVITYTILDPVAYWYFEVNDNGVMTLRQPISHLDFQNITFILFAIDNGVPSLNGTATIFIQVIDMNMHRPEFVQEFYNLEVRSDTPVEATVLTIEAVDLDLPSTSLVSYFLLKPDDTFNLISSGDVQSETTLHTGNKHLLYSYARDNGVPERFSDPCVIRIDIYDAPSHLVDIHMQFPLDEFKHKQEEFMKLLNEKLDPWVIKLESVKLDGTPSRTMVTIYALEDDSTATVDDVGKEKKFVSKGTLWKKLRANMQGTPEDWLREQDFSEYQPFKVYPTYPVWLTDTIGGIVFLTLLCLALLLAAILLFQYLAKRNQWLCYKTKVTPIEPKQQAVDEFDLGYLSRFYGQKGHGMEKSNKLPPVNDPDKDIMNNGKEFSLGYGSKQNKESKFNTNAPKIYPVVSSTEMEDIGGDPPAYPTDGLEKW